MFKTRKQSKRTLFTMENNKVKALVIDYIKQAEKYPDNSIASVCILKSF